MSGKSFARAATSAFIATRHGSPRFACENPMRNLAFCWRPQATASTRRSSGVSLRRRAPSLQPDRDHDNEALENELKVRIDVVEPHGIVDDADDQDADDGPADRSRAATQRRAA